MTTDEQQAIRLKELYQNHMLPLAQSEVFRLAPNVVINALIETLGSMMRNG